MGTSLGWYAINILRCLSDVVQRFEYAGIGSEYGLSLDFYRERGFYVEYIYQVNNNKSICYSYFGSMRGEI